MPQPPKPGESEKNFVSRCIPVVLKDGTAKDNQQAAAICFSMYKQHHKKSKGERLVQWATDVLLEIIGPPKKD